MFIEEGFHLIIFIAITWRTTLQHILIRLRKLKYKLG